jgi:pSer/pThr/pTyr-binding forkhead associated (FHA) protein
MPKLTLVLDRKTVQVYDLEGPTIRIGRMPDMEIVIDNVSVSRRQAEIALVDGAWMVRDLGSSNGTLVNGERLTGDRALKPGDEIGLGKYSLFFERVLTGTQPAPPPPSAQVRPGGAGRGDATMYLDAAEVERLQKAGAQKRQAQIAWEAGGRRGTHYLGPETGSLLIGTSERCDLRLPAGPRHHVLLSRTPQGYEVRNLSFWRRMRVGGRRASRVLLASGDVVEIGGLRLTFMDEVR